jgi:hypothetical protein
MEVKVGLKWEDDWNTKQWNCKKVSDYFKIKFGDKEKFSTFAVPNETGVRQRMLAGQKKQD